MAHRVAYPAIRDLVVSQLAYALGGGKLDTTEALMLLGDVIDDLVEEHGVEFSTEQLSAMATKFAIKAQAAA